MFSFQIVNHPEKFSLDESRIARIFELVIPVLMPDQDESGWESIWEQKGILNIAFLSDEEIQILNNQYRWIDSTTDVLSFHYFANFSELSDMDIAGEIILSESRILAQAEEHAHTPQKECEILVLHSILHIIGYDHESEEDYEKMWKWEKDIRNKIN